MCRVIRQVTSFFKSLESFASIAPTRETLDVVGQSNFHRVLPGAIQEAKTEKQWTEADC